MLTQLKLGLSSSYVETANDSRLVNGGKIKVLSAICFKSLITESECVVTEIFTTEAKVLV